MISSPSQRCSARAHRELGRGGENLVVRVEHQIAQAAAELRHLHALAGRGQEHLDDLGADVGVAGLRGDLPDPSMRNGKPKPVLSMALYRTSPGGSAAFASSVTVPDAVVAGHRPGCALPLTRHARDLHVAQQVRDHAGRDGERQLLPAVLRVGQVVRGHLTASAPRSACRRSPSSCRWSRRHRQSAAPWLLRHSTRCFGRQRRVQIWAASLASVTAGRRRRSHVAVRVDVRREQRVPRGQQGLQRGALRPASRAVAFPPILIFGALDRRPRPTRA